VQPADFRRIVEQNIRSRAKKRGLSLNALADLAGIARSPFFRALAGQASFTIDRLFKIAAALECRVADLVAEP